MAAAASKSRQLSLGPLSLLTLALLCRCSLQPESVAPALTAAQGAGAGAGGAIGGASSASPAAGAVNAGGAAGSALGGNSALAGSAGVPELRGPTAALSGANFPFPQNRQSQHCSYPSYRNSDVRAAYARWKADTVTANGAGNHLRVQRPKDPSLDPGSTVSEGIGYGMLIAVYMNDQTLFDELWKYEQMWLGPNQLMDWYISSNGVDRLGKGAATDADEDMAWALLMADRQWGGNGTLSDSYLNLAKRQISQVYDHEIYQYTLIRPGDTWGDTTTVNSSYFAPAYYRAFAKASGDERWNQVIQTSYDTLAKQLNTANSNSDNGLVPAWSDSDGVPNPKAFGELKTAPTNYQYDSCRTPFRIGLDYCLTGEPRAQSYVAKTSQFFATIGAKGIVDGYQLDGSPQPENGSGQSAAFVGPAAVGAMSSPSYAAFMQAGYDDVASLNLLVGGEYYDESWTVLSLLMLSGNFVDYTVETPVH